MQESVLELEIPVNNVLLMAVVYRNDELLKQPACLGFLDALLLDHVVECVPSIGILHRNS